VTSSTDGGDELDEGCAEEFGAEDHVREDGEELKDKDHDREGDDENLRDGNQLTGGQKTEASRGRW
jgi:hypothetical protein